VGAYSIQTIAAIAEAVTGGINTGMTPSVGG
jgi:hypothetical protein